MHNEMENPLEKEPYKVVPSVRKPAGGVSLFGGIDPSSAKKGLKKTGKGDIFDSDDESDIFSSKSRPVKASMPPRSPVEIKKKQMLKSEAIFDPLSIGREGDTPSEKKEVIESGESIKTAKEVKPNFNTLQASLNINPAALLPGAIPAKKDTLSKPTTFEDPAEIKTLENVSKTRVKFITC